MKLQIEPNLDFQLQAIEAACDLFRGQEVCRTELTATMKVAATTVPEDLFPGTLSQQLTLGLAESDLGIGNRLTLLDDELLENLKAIQLRGGLRSSACLASGDFTVEMETGTGKTCVYLRQSFCQSFWARGYFVSRVGCDEATIREYIRTQENEDQRLEQLNLWRQSAAINVNVAC